MFKEIFLDIETIPTQRHDIQAYIANTVKPPAVMTKAETIQKWMEESKMQAITDAIDKTGLDGAFGQVVCIGFAIGDSEQIEVIRGLDETKVLRDFNSAISKLVTNNEAMTATIIGHNVSSFDLRFLLQRFMVNGIKPHVTIQRSAQAKPWESDKVYDTMVQFAGTGNRISLDKLCVALGLAGKGEITGADVWPMVKAGRLEEVAAYCAEDVRKTRDVYRRMVFQTLPIQQAA